MSHVPSTGLDLKAQLADTARCSEALRASRLVEALAASTSKVPVLRLIAMDQELMKRQGCGPRLFEF